MALKFINKLFSRQEQSTQSMIQPNDALNLDDLSKYTQVIATKETLGYKGLRRAFDEKLPVELTVTDEMVIALLYQERFLIMMSIMSNY